MVDINKVYERVLFLANKEQRGYITPDEFNSFAEQAQLEILENYIVGLSAVAASPGMEDTVGNPMDILQERINYFYATSTSSTNTWTYPSDFFNLGTVQVNGRIVDRVSHRDLSYINASPLTAPTEKQPVYVRTGNNITLHPTSITSVSIDYIRKPLTPVWNYMDDPTGEPIYNSATSQDFELHPGEEDDLVYRILNLSGIAIKAPDVSGWSQQQETK